MKASLKSAAFLLTVALVSTLCLGGCSGTATSASPASSGASSVSSGQSSAAGSKTAAAEGKHVYMVLKNLTNPFCVTVRDAANQAAKDNNVNLTILTPLQTDNNEEINQLVEQAIASGDCDSIIIFPADSTAIVPAAEKAHDAGIPIISLNTRINSKDQIWETYIAADNLQIGYLTATRLCEAMGEGKLFLIEGVVGAQNSIDRIAGATKAAKEHPGIEIVAQQSGEMNRAKAMEVVQNLLQAHPDVKGIYCCNDEMALGAAEAVDAAGKTGKVLIAGCDVNADAVVAIRQGKIAFSCDIGAKQQGSLAVECAAKVLKGEKLEKDTMVDLKVVGKDEIGNYK